MLIWILFGLLYGVIVWYMYRRSQKSAAVPAAVAASLTTDEPIDHIEYFWRPG